MKRRQAGAEAITGSVWRVVLGLARGGLAPLYLHFANLYDWLKIGVIRHIRHD